MIIRGGVNIAPLEIDNVVMKHPGAMEVCTVGVPDDIYGEKIVCYIVPRAGKSLSADDIAVHCAEHLPDFKHPAEAIITDTIARNSRGKVDRNAMKDIWMDTQRKKLP